MESLIAQNYHRVLEAIGEACLAANQSPASVKLVVVTKGHPLPVVMEAVLAGARCLGENYVEEAVEKIAALQGMAIEWRMIGHVQSRKAQAVVEHFTCCDSVDSLKLAVRLDRFAHSAGRRLPVLLECNVSGEESKFGFPAWAEENWPVLSEELSSVVALPGLEICGLMTMPPFFDQPERVRPYFQRLHRLQGYLSEQFPQVNWTELSMGMSGDYIAAIQEGATQVRVGTAIMGSRQ